MGPLLIYTWIDHHIYLYILMGNICNDDMSVSGLENLYWYKVKF